VCCCRFRWRYCKHRGRKLLSCNNRVAGGPGLFLSIFTRRIHGSDQATRLIRPRITTPGDYFSFTEALRNGEALEDLGAIRERYNQLASEGTAAYRQERTQLEENASLWLSLQPLYKGVRDMFAGLSSMPPVSFQIISGRDERTIRRVLEGNSLEGVECIVDSAFGRRPQQFAELSNRGFAPQRTVTYDDAGENLLTARKMGIHPVAAPQGYDLPENLVEFKQARPEQFPGVVRELLGI